MYESQFLLKRRPFSATPDPRCFFSNSSIQGVLDEVIVCAEQGHGIAVVTAPAGTGKTTFCERLGLELEERFEIVKLYHASFMTRRALLQTILAELNHSYRRHEEQELRLELIPAIRALGPHREALVLICDEAHDLNEDLLEELRMLSDLAEQGRPLVRLVLVGQPALEETLAQPSLQALNQRIRAHVYLETFDRISAVDYIDYRITWAGGRLNEVFTPDALEIICQASQGVPRCINQLCDHALLLAYVAEQKPVTGGLIREALEDLRRLPLHWHEGISARSSDESVYETDSDAETGPLNKGQYESLEIGADLPDFDREDSALIEAPQLPPASQIAPSTSELEPSISDQFETIEEPACLDSGLQQVQCHHDNPAPSLGDFAPVRADAGITSGDTEEEVVWDRYAAIDGGFPLPERSSSTVVSGSHNVSLSSQTFSADSMGDRDTDAEDQVHEPSEIPHQNPNLAPDKTENRAAFDDSTEPEISESIADDFDSVCSRLDQRIPELHSSCDWDAAFKSSEIGRSAGSVTDGWESIESQLGQAICELRNEVRAGLPTDSSRDIACEQLEQLLGNDTASASATGWTVRPYRNLFSQLRRKQRGL